MQHTKTFIKNISKEVDINLVLIEMAKEQECIDPGNHIMLSGWSEKFTGYNGIENTVAYRKHKSGEVYQFIVRNSFSKEKKDRQTTIDFILMD